MKSCHLKRCDDVADRLKYIFYDGVMMTKYQILKKMLEIINKVHCFHRKTKSRPQLEKIRIFSKKKIEVFAYNFLNHHFFNVIRKTWRLFVFVRISFRTTYGTKGDASLGSCLQANCHLTNQFVKCSMTEKIGITTA